MKTIERFSGKFRTNKEDRLRIMDVYNYVTNYESPY